MVNQDAACRRLSNRLLEIKMDTCSICKKMLPDVSRETWISDDGIKIEIGITAEASAVVETSVGEITICESCYSALPSFFTQRDLYEIHYQFGLEFIGRKQHLRSVDAIRSALAIRTTADALAVLASELDKLGNRDEAIRLYEKALAIEPDHFMSRENIKIINGNT